MEVYREPKLGRVVLPLDPAQPPLNVEWIALSRLLVDRERIERQTREIRSAIGKLERGVREAQAKDRTELAAKLRSGSRKDISDQDKHEREAKEALTAAHRRHSALIEAAEMVEDEIAQLIAHDAPERAQEMRSRERDALARLTKLGEELTATHLELLAARRMATWLENPAVRVKQAWQASDAVPLGHQTPSGDEATMGTSEFVSLLLSHEAGDNAPARSKAGAVS